MKGQLKNLALIAIVLALVTAGCSASAPQASDTFPTGTFRGLMSGAGEFFLELKPDGNFTITANASNAAASGEPQKSSGTYSVAQNNVVFTGSLCDSGDKASGTYTWSFENSRLLLNAVKESCHDRWLALNLVWTKQ